MFDFKPHKFFPGVHAVENYPNGYGVSVVQHEHSYGGEDGKYELAVLKGDDLCYDTPITNDVVGWLTLEEARQIADRVKEL